MNPLFFRGQLITIKSKQLSGMIFKIFVHHIENDITYKYDIITDENEIYSILESDLIDNNFTFDNSNLLYFANLFINLCETEDENSLFISLIKKYNEKINQ